MANALEECRRCEAFQVHCTPRIVGLFRRRVEGRVIHAPTQFGEIKIAMEDQTISECPGVTGGESVERVARGVLIYADQKATEIVIRRAIEESIDGPLGWI